MSDTVRKDYLIWLSDLVDISDKDEAGGYGFLIKALFRKEFYWIIDKDENRAEEGKNLRGIFCDECGIDDIPDSINGPCTVLEMLIGLAKRWNDEVSLSDNEDNSSVYFWEMIANLGLEGCTDDKFDPEMVREKLENLMDRSYGTDGKGSLFPLSKSKEHQNEIEIWYQLQNYLMENYGY